MSGNASPEPATASVSPAFQSSNVNVVVSPQPAIILPFLHRPTFEEVFIFKMQLDCALKTAPTLKIDSVLSLMDPSIGDFYEALADEQLDGTTDVIISKLLRILAPKHAEAKLAILRAHPLIPNGPLLGCLPGHLKSLELCNDSLM